MNLKWMSGKLVHVAVVGVVLLVHIALVLRSYPVDLCVSNEVPLRGDVARYYATAHGSAEIGGLFGYDPHYMAGYPVGLWNSMGKKGYEVLHLLMPNVPLPRLFYLTIVGTVLFAPLLLWLGLWRRFETRGEGVLLLCLLLGYWHLSTQISYFWGFGNVFFPFASCLAVLMCALLHRALRTPRFPLLSTLGLGVLAAWVFYAHTVVLIVCIVPLLAVLFLFQGKSKWSRAFPVVGGALVVFGAVVAPWFLALMQSRGDCVAQPEQWFQGGPKHFVMDVFSDRVYRQHFDRNFLYQAAVVFGLAGTGFAWRDRRDVLLTALGLGGVGALVITYGFSYFDRLSSVQPYRFVIPATLLLLGPAAFAVARCTAAVSQANRNVRWAAALLMLVLMPAVTAYVLDMRWGGSDIGLTADRAAVVAAVKILPGNGRILVDDAGLGHVLPHTTGRAVIGGLSSQAFLKHRFAGIDEKGVLFGRPPGIWDNELLARYLDAYAVDYAILSTPRWTKRAKVPGSPFVYQREVGGQTLYRIGKGTSDYLIQGDAEVQADYDGIHISEMRSDEIIIKFHYADWLGTDADGVRLAPEQVLDDPVPFIKVTNRNNVDAFVIRRR